MERLVHAAMRHLLDHVASLPDQPLDPVGPAMEEARQRVRELREELPREGAPVEELLETLFSEAIPLSYNAASPGYLAYVPGGGLFHSAVADLIAGVVNRYVGVWRAAPALVEIEASVLRWFAEIIGYPEGARGVLTTGGSVATLNALIAARQNRLPKDFLSGVIYVSDQVHHSVEKAVRLAGFPDRALRVIPADDACRLPPDRVEAEIARDRTDGRVPFMLVGSAGTTNTGAIDDLPALATIAEREQLWFHVDAAYGGFFMLTTRGRERLRGIERSDSVVLDPHKGLFLPYGTGALLVRDGPALRRAFSATGSYMPDFQDAPDLIDFCEISPELSRDFRGLRVWLPFKMHGIGPFVRNLDEKLDLTLWAAEEIRAIDDMRIFSEPQLSIVAFSLEPEDLTLDQQNALNEDLLRRINATQRVALTATTVNGRFVVRICVLSFRTHADRIREAVHIIREAAADALVAARRAPVR